MMQESLKSVIAAVLVSLATMATVSGAANAGLCTASTMSVYDPSSFSCTIGDMTFSNFLYNGAGTGIADTAVGVTPVSSSGEVGLLFNGAWTASSSTQDVLIDFTVTETNPSTDPNRISDALLQIPVGTGTFTDIESFSATSQELTDTDLSAHTLGLPPSISVNVADDLELDPGANVSQIEKLFSDASIPEPASLALLAAGLLGLGAFRRFRN